MGVYAKHPYWGEHRHHVCPLDSSHDGPCACRYCNKTQDHANGSPDASR